jgi:hypothetical protein
VFQHLLATRVIAGISLPLIQPVQRGVIVRESEAVLLAEDIEGAVPADSVEPGLEILPDALGVGEVELELLVA